MIQEAVPDSNAVMINVQPLGSECQVPTITAYEILFGKKIKEAAAKKEAASLAEKAEQDVIDMLQTILIAKLKYWSMTKYAGARS